MGGLAIVGAAGRRLRAAHIFAAWSSPAPAARDARHRRRRRGRALDDWIKVSRERNLGLNKRAKMLGLLVVAVGFAVLMLDLTDGPHPSRSPVRRPASTSVNRAGRLGGAADPGTTNAVNLTDGLDGLAAGSSIFAFAAFVVIGFWAFRHPSIYEVPTPSTSPSSPRPCSAGAPASCGGTRRRRRSSWATPGSLAIGAALACLALTTNTQLLLPIIGFLFVIETVSVILQVAASGSSAARSSAWRRSTTTSSSAAGPRPP
jgi:phospho-N-acetylmuramoyl-pentapeptide-transferase